MFIVTNGPTGVGKTHQMQRIMDAYPGIATAVLSVTTRVRRGPVDDVWYRFVTRDELAGFDPADILSNVEFRGERYLLLRSEIEKALARAPIAFMAIVTPVIMLMRERGIPHSVVSCRVGNPENYRKRLARRGYEGDALEREVQAGISFLHPPEDPAWPQRDVMLGDDELDDTAFESAVRELAPGLLPASRL